ncbi:MAG: polysaccharide deacetylase family protein [Planctomycetota bacterium]|nr:MAG: polysaccharide deacetylase family protein [Planctomycetota bacterium]
MTELLGLGIAVIFILGARLALGEDEGIVSRAIRQPIPDKLVVLTFDDSSRSHHGIVRPILKEYGFGATFFITEGFDFPINKDDYLTWAQIRELHDDGFEIGNHTRNHLGINHRTLSCLDDELDGIAEGCAAQGIPAPVTFAWPGNANTEEAFALLHQRGILFARRGGAPEYPYDEGRGFAYEPGKDHPLLLPSAGDARPKWTLPDLIRAVEQARDGRIAILQFHGAPDTAHDWVSTGEQSFRSYMKYLKIEGYRVIALRDLQEYVDPAVTPEDYKAVIESRKKSVEAEAVETTSEK